MDPLTHSVFGMACAVAAVRDPKLRRPAVLAGVSAGLLPDADIYLTSATDPLFSMEYHRHFTHSVVLAPVIALIAVAFTVLVYRVFKRRISMKALFMPALVAALGHGFCDVWTSYGTRSWWPFSDARVTLDWISVIDPVFTIPLLVLAVLAWRYASRKLAVTGLVWVTLYLTLCQIQKSRAEEALAEWVTSQGLPASDRSTVKPSFGNILVWRAMAQHGDQMQVAAVRCNLLGKTQIIPGEKQKVFDSPLQAARALGLPEDSRQAKDIARFFHFSDNWVGVHPDDPLTLGDLRYATMPGDIRPLWGIRLDPQHPETPVSLAYFRTVSREDFLTFFGYIKGEGWMEKSPDK